LVESNLTALCTDIVLLDDEYHAIEHILKNLDSMNIKIFSAMWKLGPRNLLEVARQTGIPFTSVYHRVERIERESELAYLVPKLSKLGMMRVVVLVAARLGCEEAVTKALTIPNLWVSINTCEGTFTHDAVNAVPIQHINEFREYVRRLAQSGLITRFKIIPTGDYLPNFPDFDYYDARTHQWKFEWDRWFSAMIHANPTACVQDPRSYNILVDKKDLLIIKELEKNYRKSFADLAPVAGMSLHGVKYHFDKKLVPEGIVQNYQFNVVPYPKEVSAFHEIMLEFNSEIDMNRFLSVLPRLFFIIGASKVLRRNAILVRTYILESQLAKLFVFFSQLAKAGLLQSFSLVRKHFQSRRTQTISYELFDDEKGWAFNIEKCLEQLSKLRTPYAK
jgi:DNA-binding Lrp family transcriptional regulator